MIKRKKEKERKREKTFIILVHITIHSFQKEEYFLYYYNFTNNIKGKNNLLYIVPSLNLWHCILQSVLEIKTKLLVEMQLFLLKLFKRCCWNYHFLKTLTIYRLRIKVFKAKQNIKRLGAKLEIGIFLKL